MSNDNSSDDRALDFDPRPDVTVLASTVISVLSEKSDEGARAIRASIVRKLVKATLREDAFNAEQLCHELRNNRLEPEQIIDLYIPEAARLLGDMWLDDAISFAQVTIASGRLQGMLTLLSPPWRADALDPGEATHALMVLQSGDTHTLGPHLAASQLRRLGASVHILFGPSPSDLSDTIADEPYDLILFSCSRAEMLETIAEMVKRIRTELKTPPAMALGGLVLSLTDRVKERTGVDVVTDDVRVALRIGDRNRLKPRIAAP